MIEQRTASRRLLAVDRDRAAQRLVSMLNTQLETLLVENGGVDLQGLKENALALVDRVAALDQRLASSSAMGCELLAVLTG